MIELIPLILIAIVGLVAGYSFVGGFFGLIVGGFLGTMGCVLYLKRLRQFQYN